MIDNVIDYALSGLSFQRFTLHRALPCAIDNKAFSLAEKTFFYLSFIFYLKIFAKIILLIFIAPQKKI
jgi:hypothetical protein